MENTLTITYFNRHESMDHATRNRTLDLISDLVIATSGSVPGSIMNMLHGLFDGYDYSDEIRAQHKFLNQLNDSVNTRLVNEILAITEIIKNYPRTNEPNNNIF